ncbi:hypothetical protein BC332_27545 [Capsicum chinense]|nr:hypothetical protein BC332_27545 [Capsicum chinense]
MGVALPTRFSPSIYMAQTQDLWLKGIHEFIVSFHFKSNKVEVTTIDSQSSVTGGVLVVVTGSLIGQDESRKRFSQTFFLTPQEMRYYVLNDIFGFIGIEEASKIVEEKVDENAPISPLATESKAENIVASSQKEEQVLVETGPIIANEAPKVSYASMALMSSSGGVEKVAAPPTNVAQDNYDDLQRKFALV